MSRNCAIPVSEYLGSARPEEHQLSSCADKPIGEDNEFFALVNWGIRKSAFWCTFTHRSGNDGHAKSMPSVFPIRTPDHFLVTSLGGKPLALLGQNVTKNHPWNDAKCETEVTLPLPPLFAYSPVVAMTAATTAQPFARKHETRSTISASPSALANAKRRPAITGITGHHRECHGFLTLIKLYYCFRTKRSSVARMQLFLASHRGEKNGPQLVPDELSFPLLEPESYMISRIECNLQTDFIQFIGIV